MLDLVAHPARVVPVGRLDIATTGALLLTNDGDLAHRLAHPRYGVEKEYVADVEGAPTDGDAAQAGRRASSSRTGRPPRRGCARLGRSRIELTLHEGRNRQVRRMCEAVGHPVRRLHRSRYAGLGVGKLAPGGAGASSRPGEVSALRSPSPRTSARSVGAEAARGLLGADARAGGAARPRRRAAPRSAPGSARAARRPTRPTSSLNCAVAGAVVAGLDLRDRLARRDRHDLDQVRHARLLARRRGGPRGRSR